MKKSALTTTISILLIVASLFALIAAGFGVKDGLAIKQYKEEDAKAEVVAAATAVTVAKVASTTAAAVVAAAAMVSTAMAATAEILTILTVHLKEEMAV